MKRTYSMLLAAVLAMNLLAGCKKAPEPAALTQTNQDRLLNTAQKGGEDSSTLDALELPEKFTGQWTGLDGCFHVRADASITLPEVSEIPTATVTRHSFTQEDVDKLLEEFLKGNPLYEQQGETKQSATARLEQYKAAQRGEIPLSDVTVDHTMEELPKIIKRWEEIARTAPDESERFPASTTLQPDSSRTWADEIVDGYAEVDGRNVYVAIFNRSDSGDEARIYWEGYGDNNARGGWTHYVDELQEPVEVSINEAEALEMGNALMERLGIDWVVCDQSKSVAFYRSVNGEAEMIDTGYELEYVRAINGFPISQFNRNFYQYEADGTSFAIPGIHGTSIPENEPYIGTWAYESITVYVTKDGVADFHWVNPYTQPVIQTENTKLMKFQDIAQIFSKMIFVKNHIWQEADVKNGFVCLHDVDVDRVQLNLMRIRDKNSLSQGTIVPVWDFWGKTSVRPEDDAYRNVVFDGAYYEIVLTINAIDGTMIDRALGY